MKKKNKKTMTLFAAMFGLVYTGGTNQHFFYTQRSLIMLLYSIIVSIICMIIIIELTRKEIDGEKIK